MCPVSVDPKDGRGGLNLQSRRPWCADAWSTEPEREGVEPY
jgi:hypothetical protein